MMPAHGARVNQKITSRDLPQNPPHVVTDVVTVHDLREVDDVHAEGIRGALGRGGTYTILGRAAGSSEKATGFSLYPDPLIDALAAREARRDALFLPLGHDAGIAASLRGKGWRTVAALAEADDAAALGCTHVLRAGEPVAL